MRKVTISFTDEDLKDVIINYYRVDEEEFDIDDYDEVEIREAILGSISY